MNFSFRSFLTIFLSVFLLYFCSDSNPTKSENSEDEIAGTVTDIDGNVYNTIKIGNQWWMAENLRVTNYHDGSAIPNITDGEEWSRLDTGAFCTYENDPGYVLTHGLLYNWYAATDNRGICPDGWHVPSDGDW